LHCLHVTEAGNELYRLPGLQGKQKLLSVAATANDAVPALQFLHAVLATSYLSKYVPGLHWMQATPLPPDEVASAYMPGPHVVHEVAPVYGATLPASHEEQFVLPTVLPNLPFGHFLHPAFSSQKDPASPTVSEYVPMGQCRHSVEESHE
jgi:hypothetical protein